MDDKESMIGLINAVYEELPAPKPKKKKNWDLDSKLLNLKIHITVNIMEDGLSKEAALKVYHRIFKTECGKKICKEMFNIC